MGSCRLLWSCSPVLAGYAKRRGSVPTASEGTCVARCAAHAAGQLGVWLPHGIDHGVLAGKYLVTVRVAKLTNNRVLLAGLIAVSCQINQIVVDEFSSIWAFETAEHEI